MGRESFARGPRALVPIRNDLGHEELKRDILTFEAYKRGRELVFWYVELWLLALLGYRELHLNAKPGNGQTMSVAIIIGCPQIQIPIFS